MSLDRPRQTPTKRDLTTAQTAFAELLGDALARQWIAEGNQAADGANKPSRAGQQIYRSDEK